MKNEYLERIKKAPVFEFLGEGNSNWDYYKVAWSKVEKPYVVYVAKKGIDAGSGVLGDIYYWNKVKSKLLKVPD